MRDQVPPVEEQSCRDSNLTSNVLREVTPARFICSYGISCPAVFLTDDNRQYYVIGQNTEFDKINLFAEGAPSKRLVRVSGRLVYGALASVLGKPQVKKAIFRKRKYYYFLANAIDPKEVGLSARVGPDESLIRLSSQIVDEYLRGVLEQASVSQLSRMRQRLKRGRWFGTSAGYLKYFNLAALKPIQLLAATGRLFLWRSTSQT